MLSDAEYTEGILKGQRNAAVRERNSAREELRKTSDELGELEECATKLLRLLKDIDDLPQRVLDEMEELERILDF